MTSTTPVTVGSSTSSPQFARVLAAYAVAAALFGDHGTPSMLAALAVALAAGVLAFRQATLLLALAVVALPAGLFVGAIVGLWVR